MLNLIGYTGGAYAPEGAVFHYLEAKSDEIGMDIDVIYGYAYLNTVQERIGEPNPDRLTIMDCTGVAGAGEFVTNDSLVLSEIRDPLTMLGGEQPTGRRRFRVATTYLPTHRSVFRSLRAENPPPDGFQRMELPSSPDHDMGLVSKNLLLYRFGLANLNDLHRAGIRHEQGLLDGTFGWWIDVATDPEIWKEIEEREARRQQELMQVVLEQMMQNSTLGIRSEIDSTEEQLGQLQNRLGELETRLLDRYREFERIQSQTVQDVEGLEHMFQQLGEHARIEKLTVVNNQIHVYTDTIYLHSPDRQKRTVLGKFKLKLDVANNSAWMENITNAKNGRSHPHVSRGGIACYGGHDGAIRQLLRDNELPTLVDTLINYLETYNPFDSAGAHSRDWWEQGCEVAGKKGTWSTPSTDSAGRDLAAALNR